MKLHFKETLNDEQMKDFRNKIKSDHITSVGFDLDSNFGLTGMKYLCESLDLLPNLKQLTIYENPNIDDECVKLLVESSRLTPMLSHLSLTGTSISSLGLEYLLSIRSLKSLNIRRSLKTISIKKEDDGSILDFNLTLRVLNIDTIFKIPVNLLLRNNLMFYFNAPYEISRVKPSIGRYRLKIWKFIWLIAKRKIDEFLLIEFFHKLK